MNKPNAERSSADRRFLITHPEMGVFLGYCMGLAFWSKLDPVGQPSAVTFSSADDARKFLASWRNGGPSNVAFHPVIADEFECGNQFASISACVKAGLDGWLDETVPVANELPI